MKELIEVTPAVISKRFTVSEPPPAIESQCRFEGRAASSLKTEATQPTPAGFANDVFKEGSGDALA